MPARGGQGKLSVQVNIDRMAATIGYQTLEIVELKRENAALREMVAKLEAKLPPLKEADAK